MSGLLDAIRSTNRAFQQVNAAAPEAIILATNEEGMRLFCELQQMRSWQPYAALEAGSFGKPVEHPDGSVWMEILVCGIKVRWPALKHALPNGGYVWQ